jgi:hypothetical protein
MMTKITTFVSAIALSVALSVAGGVVGPGVHAAGKMTTAQASRTCNANHNAVFGSAIHISHGACVATMTSQGRSSTLYANLCSSIMKSNAGTLSGVAPSTTTGFLNTTTMTTINKILSAVKMPSSGKFANVGQCVAAFNKAKHTALHTSGTSGTSGKHSGKHG